MKTHISWLLIGSMLICCTFNGQESDNPGHISEQNTAGNEKVYFKNLVDVENIEKVLIRNNFGENILNDTQLNKLKTEMSNMKLHGCCPIKPGAISFEITIDGKTYTGYSSTGSNLLFFDDLPIARKHNNDERQDIYFEMPDGMNLDNYK